MEIEKKFLVHRPPDKLDQYPCVKIEQGYLCVHPVIRIRKWNDEYILTYKRKEEQDAKSQVCINQEVELPLNKHSYQQLKTKIDGVMIEKERYLIPYGNKKIELDIFHGDYEGMILAEVEFLSVEEADAFEEPDWFGENVSGDIRYSNAYLALGEGIHHSFG